MLHTLQIYVDRVSQGAADGSVFSNISTSGSMILMILIAVVGYIVQARLQSVFSKYSEVSSPGGMTGAELAEKMLRDNGIDNVRVTHVKGHLTDHFDPRTLTVNLSDSVYSSRSVAAAAPATSAATPYSTPRATHRLPCARSWCRSSASRRRSPRGSYWPA